MRMLQKTALLARAAWQCGSEVYLLQTFLAHCPFAAGRDMDIIQRTAALAEAAMQLDPQSPVYAVEAGYQRMLAGDVAGALERYRRASRLNELDIGAMYGTIECELLSGKVGNNIQHKGKAIRCTGARSAAI